MRTKLAVITLYLVLIAMPAVLFAETFAQPPDAQQADPAKKVMVLDKWGRRGIVFFDHKGHEELTTTDPARPFKAERGAACSGCHHTLDAQGIPQLWKCNVCHHRIEGNPETPKNSRFDEVMAERAYHDSCIPCHRYEKKGPKTCSGCHKPGVSPDAAQ